MRVFLFILLLASSGITYAQPSLLSAAYNTPKDDLLIGFAHPKPNRLVFAAIQLKEESFNRWSDGFVFVTDAQGQIVHQRSFLHNGDSASFIPAVLFATDSTIEVFGGEGHSLSDYAFPIAQTLRWIKMDTALNILEEKSFPLASGRSLFDVPKAVRLDGYTYMIYNKWLDYADQNRIQPYLLRFDSAMNLLVNRRMDPALYNTTLNVNGGYLYDISLYTPSRKLYVNGSIRITSSSDSLCDPSTFILHKLDTGYTLLDTFQYAPSTFQSNGYDTILGTASPETLPLDEYRLWVGPSFRLTNVFQFIYRERVGLSLYNTTTRRFKRKYFAPNYDSVDDQSCGGYTKSIAQDGSGHVYALGASHCIGGGVGAYDNALVLVKYDTAGNLLWHRFINHNGGFYKPSVIHCDGDSIITILATRYDHAALWPTTFERDFYVLRLRASDGAPTAVFQLPTSSRGENITAYPNPASETLRLRIPASVKATEISILSSTGATMRSARTAIHGDTDISVADLPPGIYTWRLQGADGSAGASGLFLKR